MEISELRAQDEENWNEYVYQSAQASAFHLAGWKQMMEQVFGLRPRFLLAQASCRVVGILPLLHVKSRLAGHYFTSMPGGLCAQDQEVAAALLEKAKELVRTHQARYLILRDSHHKWDLPGLVTTENHCTTVVKLSDDPEQVWRNVKRRARQLTNKAMRADVTAAVGPSGMDDFYPAYSRAMREKGTPTLGRRFFDYVALQFPAHFDLITIHRNGQVIGGGSIAPFKDTVYCTWGGMLSQYYDHHPSHLLYWETLKYGCERGYQWVDLGRSQRDSGAFTFKMNWGGELQPLYQQFYLNGLAQPPSVGGRMTTRAQYRLFIKLWQRLPLAVAEILGPWLRKRMPFG